MPLTPALALVLESAQKISLRMIDLPLEVGPHDVKIRIEVVGICGSDVHYYKRGRIGPFVVTAPMVLGHEAAGIVTATGSAVTTLKAGDRVAIEPGVPDWSSPASRQGLYNLDPSLRFWATPPEHGCLTPEVVHPANLCFKLPDHVTAAAGAMIEPLAVCLQAIAKAGISPGDTAVVLGAGPIGLLQALSARAAGCAEVFVFDPQVEKHDLIARLPGLTPLHPEQGSPQTQVLALTEQRGADILFECSGAPAAFENIADYLRPGGRLAAVGMPPAPVGLDIVALQVKEITLHSIFRYANVYDRAIKLLAQGQIDVTPLITETFDFADSITAFERAAAGRARDIKIQIKMPTTIDSNKN